MVTPLKDMLEVGADVIFLERGSHLVWWLWTAKWERGQGQGQLQALDYRAGPWWELGHFA